MLIRLGPRGGGSAAGGLVAAALAAEASLFQSSAATLPSTSTTTSSSLACSIRRHLSANAPPSDSSSSPSSSSSSSPTSSSSSQVADDPRWKSPLFDALLQLAARAIPSSATSTATSTSTSTSRATTTTATTTAAPIREVISERQELWTFFADTVRLARSRVLSGFVSKNFETSFDEREFLEGAADARHAVFDALSSEGSLAPLRGAVAPGLLGALYGIKGMHRAAGLSVRMVAEEDDVSNSPVSSSTSSSPPPPRAVVSAMSILDPKFLTVMSEAAPGKDSLAEIKRDVFKLLLREKREKNSQNEAASSNGDSGSGISDSSGSSNGSGSRGSSGSSGSDSSGSSSSDSSVSSSSSNNSNKKKKNISSAVIDEAQTLNVSLGATLAAGVGGLVSGRYQALDVRFDGGVLVRTFAAATAAGSGLANAAAASDKENNEENIKEGGEEGNEEKKKEESGSKTTATETPPPTATLTLVRELLDKRPHTWRFVRGPLPEGLPVRQLGLPWMLLSIDTE